MICMFNVSTFAGFGGQLYLNSELGGLELKRSPFKFKILINHRIVYCKMNGEARANVICFDSQDLTKYSIFFVTSKSSLVIYVLFLLNVRSDDLGRR